MANLFENISEKNILKLKRILSANTVKYKKNVNILSNVNPDNFIALVDSGSVQFIFNDYDGNKTIIEIGKDVEEKFGDKATPLYERLAKYIKILESYNFILFKK